MPPWRYTDPSTSRFGFPSSKRSRSSVGSVAAPVAAGVARAAGTSRGRQARRRPRLRPLAGRPGALPRPRDAQRLAERPRRLRVQEADPDEGSPSSRSTSPVSPALASACGPTAPSRRPSTSCPTARSRPSGTPTCDCPSPGDDFELATSQGDHVQRSLDPTERDLRQSFEALLDLVVARDSVVTRRRISWTSSATCCCSSWSRTPTARCSRRSRSCFSSARLKQETGEKIREEFDIWSSSAKRSSARSTRRNCSSTTTPSRRSCSPGQAGTCSGSAPKPSRRRSRCFAERTSRLAKASTSLRRA